jgi:AbrB family looped-hinge helix DNA binding protein
MKVTTKGQVTIPQEIRERPGIHPGVDVEFAVEGSVVKLVPVRRG